MNKIFHCHDFVYWGDTFDSTGTDAKEMEKQIVQTKNVLEVLIAYYQANT